MKAGLGPFVQGAGLQVSTGRLIEMGVTWMFKQAHGLTYDEDFRQYQLELRQSISRAGGAPVISLDDARRLTVSPYSYNLPDSGYGAV